MSDEEPRHDVIDLYDNEFNVGRSKEGASVLDRNVSSGSRK